MRVLFHHQNQLRNLTTLHGNSLFATYRDLIRGAKEKRSKLVGYLAVPKDLEKHKGISWSESELSSYGFVPVPISNCSTSMFQFPAFEVDFVNKIKDKNFIVDCVWTSSFAQVTGLRILQNNMPSRWDVNIKLPIVNYFMETTLDKNFSNLKRDEVMGSIALSAVSGPIVVMNNFDEDELRRKIKAYLSPICVMKALKNIYMVPPCFNGSVIESFFDTYEKERAERLSLKKINIFHGGLMEAKRHLVDLIKAVVEVRKYGIDLHVWVVSQRQSEYSEDWIHSVNNCTGKDYLKTFGKGDLLWMFSDYEGTGIGYMEAIKSGMIPICNSKALWVKDRICKEYPYWINCLPGNLVSVLLYMCKNFSSIKEEWQGRLIEDIGEWSNLNVIDIFLRVLEEAVVPRVKENIEISKKCFAFSFLKNAVSRGKISNIITIPEVYKLITLETDKNLSFTWVGHRVIRYMLMALGYQDTYKDGNVVLIKE